MAKQGGGNRNVKNARNTKIPKGRNRNNIKSNKFATQKSRPLKAKEGVKKVFKKQLGTNILDARQKIIQKKRKTVVDARDVLAKMAKTQDARSKIDKIRNGVRSSHSDGNVKVIGSSILKKTDRNGKVSLVTNKPKGSALGMNLAIQKQLGLITPNRGNARKSNLKRNTVPEVRGYQPPIRKTIVNDFEYASSIDPSKLYDPALYKWIKPDLRPASHMINSLESTRQAMRDVMREEMRGWPSYYPPKPPRLGPSGYIDLDAVEDEEMPLAPVTPSRISLHGSQRISNVHSRLDRVSLPAESHGILCQTKTKVVVPVGHRIVVSNLQQTVTQDDIKELFEDIGQLLTARLVRPGVAEVIYKNLKDAQRAVDTYHNRQLDGQPMKCLLVNKRPVDRPTAAPVNKSDGFFSLNNRRTNKDVNTVRKSPSKSFMSVSFQSFGRAKSGRSVGHVGKASAGY